MKETWRSVLTKYGQNVTLHPEDGEEVTCKAFLQPLRETGSDWFQRLPTPLGMSRRDRWIYLGDPDHPLDSLGEEGWIGWRNQRFTLRSVQPVCVGEETLYWWGLLAVEDPEEAERDGI
ncbi:hypothetical protein [Pseudoflavonifractor phocaeensis]|uniref:hypothetical protein n=1 Tax=Pseudoflavonifractor phocaeensis TaxID=1870988 RepID=UPI0019591388|nr:hypothetical protein [Pseudoflavonifractor phocaeensis]MBM6926228.1 hypothetical protein [Pseudoflavonifractor phocaeensis]